MKNSADRLYLVIAPARIHLPGKTPKKVEGNNNGLLITDRNIKVFIGVSAPQFNS